jgi:hypothetical protein
MGFKKFVFPVAMVFLMVMTIAKYDQIRRFRASSKEYSFVVVREDVEAVKEKLESITYQPVEEEVLYDGSRRLIVRCPPDKLGMISSILNARREE